MVFAHHLLLVLSILTVKEIAGQYYSQPNLNSRFYNGNVNRNFNGNSIRYNEAAVKPCEIRDEVIAQAQTPCRNKEANKDHKDSLWWTLPIPPMELEGTPEKTPQIKQAEPVSIDKPQSSGGETGAIQQKHMQIVASSTSKAPAVVPTVAAVQVTTSKHETSSSSAKQERTKVIQMQKQQQQQQQLTASSVQQTQQAVPVPNVVVSNKETSGPLISNKSIATMRAPGTGRVIAPINPHGANKQKVMFNMMDPAGYQYSQDSIQMPQAYLNNPYYNTPYFREPQLVSNRGYRSDNVADDTMVAVADNNMYKDFDSNDAEIGGGAVVGENAPFVNNQAQANMAHYEPNFASAESQDSSQWSMPSEDERNKRNPLDKFRHDVKRQPIS